MLHVDRTAHLFLLWSAVTPSKSPRTNMTTQWQNAVSTVLSAKFPTLFVFCMCFSAAFESPLNSLVDCLPDGMNFSTALFDHHFNDSLSNNGVTVRGTIITFFCPTNPLSRR